MNASIMKKSLSGILVLVLVLSLLPGMAIRAVAEEASAELPVLNRTVVGTVDFQCFNFLGDNDYGSDGVDYSSTFYYTDDFFSPSAVSPNADSKSEKWTELTDTELSLAATSFDLTVAAYASNEDNVLSATSRSWDNTDYSEKDKNARAMLETCGFENFESYGTYNQPPTNDSIAYVIASKTIKVWDEESGTNKDFTLIAVAVRGAGYGAEWAGNVTLGDPSTKALPANGRHYGFDQAANTVCSGIRQYLSDHSISSDVKYWITGFSRAGATANLVAANVTDDAESIYHTHQRDVYGYTWECPQAAATSEHALDYKNIHNIINAMDAVPKVSPDEFQHQRLGVDYVMPYHGNTTAAQNTTYYNNMYEVLKTIAVGADNYAGKQHQDDILIETVDPRNYPYNRVMTIYKMDAGELMGQVVSYALNPNNDTLLKEFGTVEAEQKHRNFLITYGNVEHLLGYANDGSYTNTTWYLDDYINALVDVFLTSNAWVGGTGTGRTPIQNRDTFIHDYQEDFRTLFGYFLDFTGPAFLGMAPKLIDAVTDNIGTSLTSGFAWDFVRFYNDPSNTSKKNNLISSAKTLAVNVANDMTADFSDEQLQGISRQQMNDAIRHMAELLINLYSFELSEYDSQYLGTTLRYLNTILCTHEQEVVMSWIKSLDSNHINRGYRTLTVPKNTDVKLYEFRDRYADMEGTLSADGKGALVAEVKDGSFVPMEDPIGTTVDSLDQRISVATSGNDMIIRYPSMLDIRLDVSAKDEDTYFDDVSFRVDDYQTKTMTQAISDGEGQYASATPGTANYTKITTQTAKTNAQTINGYDSSYTVPLSSHDVLQIMANGTTTYDNSASADKNVYTINKMVYVNTIVEGQFRSEDGGVETYLPYVMEQDGTVKQPAEAEAEVSYSAKHGSASAAETGTGNENPAAHLGNSFTVDLTSVDTDNSVVKYFITDAKKDNKKLSSETDAYEPAAGLVEETREQFTYNAGSGVQSLEAVDQVYHVYYDGDFKYTVLWNDEDGTKLEKDENVKYNADPEYNGETPVKESDDDDYVWVFTGWTPAVEKVTADATYTATYEQRPAAPATFTLVHQSGGEETITLNNAAKGYVVTDKVAPGMMYGGLFTTPDYKTPTTTPGTKLIPEDGKTYYLREVSKTYLQARNVYLTKSGRVIGTYGIAVTDCNNYKEAGFLFNGRRIPSMEQDGESTLYSEVTFVNVNGGNPFKPKDIYSQTETPDANAKIVVSRLDDAATGTVQAYWITADNVLVKGDTIRNLKDGYKVGTTDPNKKYSTEVNPYTEAPTYQESGIPVSSIFVGYEDEEEEPVDNGIKLAGYTTSLNGNIAMNFYMDLRDEAAADKDAYMQFTLPGANHTEEMVKLTDAKKQVRGDKTYYVFSAGVAAKDMTSDIKAQFVKGDGTKSKVWTYTIKEYCDYIRSHPESYDKESVALVENMLNYGGYAQTYFKHNTDKMANADLDLNLPTVNLDDSFKPALSGEAEGVTYKGSSAMLTTTTGLRHYFEIAGDADEYTFEADGKKLEVQSDKNGSYVLIDNIRAKDMKKPVTLTVTDKNGRSFKLSYSVYTNIKQVVENDQFGETSQNLMRALYGYGESAVQYFATR